MTTPNDNSESRLAHLLDQLCDDEISQTSDPLDLQNRLEEQLGNLSADELEQLVEAKNCVRLLDELASRAGGTLLVTPHDGADVRDDPEQIGEYEIVRKLGSGGFATVYLAKDARLGRQVALKVLNQRFAGDIDVVRRFEREARAAAMLTHRAIVPIYESGRIDQQSFIAMRYCGDGDLKAFLDDRDQPLEIGQAARITARIADAIGFAHSKGVLHRDIKPANIMLVGSESDADPSIADRIRVTDFGLVKESHFDPDLTSDAPHQSAVGTPAYMSPEQIVGDVSIGPPSDVFSIGVLLYELLSGKSPHRRDNQLRTFQSIETEVPPPPSKLRRNVPRGLDAICMKCLQKSPALRYANAIELAQDLERWIDDVPVLARRATSLETLAAWTRRNRAVSAALTIAMLSMLIGASVATWKWRSAVHQQVVAEAAQQQAERANVQVARAAENSEALVNTMLDSFSTLNPLQGGDTRIGAAEFLASAAAIVNDKFPEADAQKYRIVSSLAGACFDIGRYAQSANLWTQATQIAGQVWDENHIDYLTAKFRLADALEADGSLIDALEHRRAVLKALEESHGADATVTIEAVRALATTQLAAGQFDLALQSLQQDDEDESPERADSIDRTIELYEQQIKQVEQHFGIGHPQAIELNQRLALLLLDSGQRRQALQKINSVIQQSRQQFGNDDPRTLTAITNLAMMVNWRTSDLASPLIDQARPIALERFAITHPIVIRMDHAKGLCLWYEGRRDEAIKWLEETHRRAVTSIGPLHPRSIAIASTLTFQYRMVGRPADAIELATKAIVGLKEKVGPKNVAMLQIEMQLAHSFRQQDRYEEALTIYQRHVDLASTDYPAGHAFRSARIMALANTLMEAERFEDAVPWLRRALDEAIPTIHHAHRWNVGMLLNLAVCFLETNRSDDAKEAIQWLDEINATRTSALAIVTGLKGRLLYQEGNREAAEPMLLESIGKLKQLMPKLSRNHRQHTYLITRAIANMHADAGQQEEYDRWIMRSQGIAKQWKSR